MKTVEVRGARIPALGLGTWQLEGEDCRDAVSDALAVGYRHIDTAQAYENESEVGQGISDAKVSRDELWVTTKVWYEKARAAEVKDSTEQSLKRLKLDYVDLLLFHWPQPDVPMEETLSAMAELRERGLARHIGVSNFTPSLLRQALKVTPLTALQCEYHPFLAQEPLLKLCREREMAFTAYSPLARGKVLNDPVLKTIGEVHGKSPAQIVLRWMLQQDSVVFVPKAASKEHRRANFAITDFELTEEQMGAIDTLARGQRVIDPSFAPDWENEGRR